MVKQYFDLFESELNTDLLNDIENYLTTGYNKIKKFEVFLTSGFSLFGHPPSSVYLSAYGLFQLSEMAKVFPVNKFLISRIKKFVLSKIKIDYFIYNKLFYKVENTVVNAYIIYCLSNANIKYSKLKLIVNSIYKKIIGEEKKENFYPVALLSLSFFNFGEKEKSLELTNLLNENFNDILTLKYLNKYYSILGSCNNLETIALSVLSFLNFEEKFFENAKKGLEFIMNSSKRGVFGSTNSNVLCIKAILAFQKYNLKSEGDVLLKINEEVISTIKIKKDKKEFEAKFFDEFSKKLSPTKTNKIEIISEMDSNIPFSLNIQMKQLLPLTFEKDYPFKFSTKLLKNELCEGEKTGIEVFLKNKKEEDGLSMVLTVINISGGLTTRIENLKELKEKEIFHFYELFGPNTIVFYWEGMKKNEEIKFHFDVIANICGEFEGNSNRAYLYYSEAPHYYVKGFKVKIKSL